MILEEPSVQRTTQYSLRSAYAHRINLMMNALIQRNRELWRDNYQNLNVESSSNQYEGYEKTQVYLDSRFLNEHTEDVAGQMGTLNSALYNSDETNIENLEDMDGELANTLDEMDIMVSIPNLTDLTTTWNKSDRDTNVCIFKAKLKEIALARIEANGQGLNALQEEYKAIFDLPETVQRQVGTYSTLMDAIKKDQELQDHRVTLVIDRADAQFSFNSIGDPRAYGSEITENSAYFLFSKKVEDYDLMIEQVDQTRQLLRNAYPVICAIDTEDVDTAHESHRDIYKRIEKAFDKAREAQTEVKLKIRSDDMPLYKLDPIVLATIEYFNISENPTDAFGRDVLDWLASKRRKEWAIKLGSAVFSIGLAIACFIPGVGIAATIALGAVGAGVGAAASIYEFEMADDLYDAARSQTAGPYQLISDPEAAKKEFIWGVVNLCLGLVDAFLAGNEIFKIGNILNKFSSTGKGLKVINQMDSLDDAVRIFTKVDNLQDGATFLRKMEDASNETVQAISRVITNTSDEALEVTIKNINQFNKLDDTVIIINKFENAEEGARFLTFLDDSDITYIQQSSIDKAVNRVPFYKTFKKFKNGDIPGEVTVRVDSSVRIDIPDNTTIINSQYANEVHPLGVPFNEQGFPIFKTDFTVKIDKMFYLSSDDVQFMIGNDLLSEAIQTNDELRNALNLSNTDLTFLEKGLTPKGFTWNHNQNSGILELVNSRIHSNTGHTGGRSLWGGGQEFR